MSQFRSILNQEFNKLNPTEKNIINEVWEHRAEFIQWPAKARLLWPGCVRVRYHAIPAEIKKEAKSKPQHSYLIQ